MMKTLMWCGILSLIVFAGCKPYPYDAEDSLAHIEDGYLRIGISSNEPFTMISGNSFEGNEVDIMQAYAREKNARIIWTEGSETALAEKLQNFELDIMISGLVKESPVKEGLGYTQAYMEDSAGKHIIAVAPGENALLGDLDKFLHQYTQHHDQY